MTPTPTVATRWHINRPETSRSPGHTWDRPE